MRWKLNNQFVIVVPVYNQPERIIRCLQSIFDQSFPDLGVIIRDDCSTDGTWDAIGQFLLKQTGGLGSQAYPYFRVDANEIIECGRTLDNKLLSVIAVRNRKKHYPCGNIYTSVINHVNNNQAVIGTVDGDDALLNENVVRDIADAYDKGSYWLVWSQHQNQQGNRGCSAPLPPDEVIYAHRHYWCVSHFRTAKAWLYKQIDPKSLVDFFDRDSYVKMCGDAALLYPMIEMAGNEHSKFVDSVHYLYDDNTGLNEHSPGTVQMQHQYSALIKNMPRSAKIIKSPEKS